MRVSDAPGSCERWCERNVVCPMERGGSERSVRAGMAVGCIPILSGTLLGPYLMSISPMAMTGSMEKFRPPTHLVPPSIYGQSMGRMERGELYLCTVRYSL